MILIRKSGVSMFNNHGHVENFVKYLTRTDWNQKWTNEHTKDCLFAVRKDGHLTEMKIADGKEAIRAAICQAVKGIPFSGIGNDILAVGDYQGSEEDEEIREELMQSLPQETCLEVFHSLMEDMDSEEDILALVMHNDQDYGGKRIDNHIHRIIRLR